jgi:hypothetical protein
MNLSSQPSVDGRVRIQSLTPTNPTVEKSNRQSGEEFPTRLSTSSALRISLHNHQATGESTIHSLTSTNPTVENSNQQSGKNSSKFYLLIFIHYYH